MHMALRCHMLPMCPHSNVAGTGKADYKSAVLGKGLPASPGAAVGRIVFTADEAEKWHADGEKVGALGLPGLEASQEGWLAQLCMWSLQGSYRPALAFKCPSPAYSCAML